MRIKDIELKFKKRGYKVVRTFNGQLVVTAPNGFGKTFSSYNAAYNYYFMPYLKF